MRRNSWAGETEATSQAGAVEADAETDPGASGIDRARAAVVAGIRTSPEIVRSGKKSASNAGRSARSTARSASSTGRQGRIAGKSASNAGRTASSRAEIPEVVEIPEVAEIPSAAEAPDSLDRREKPAGDSRP
jgi:hypothetical protein